MVYEYQPTNPLGAFAQSYSLSRGIQDDITARRKAEIDAQAQQARQRDLQAAVMELRRNPSPEALAEFGLRFPEMKEGMTSYFSTLEAGKKTTLTNAARDVLIAQRAGGNVQQVFERYAAAAETGNDAATAKIFRDAAEVAKTDPESAAETARVLLGFTDPDAYKLMYDNSLYDTATIKELIAEMGPNSYGTPEFQAALKAKREGDPLIGVPGVGLFRREDVMAAGGQGVVTPSIPEGAIKMLIQNPSLRGDFDKKYGAGAADRVLGGGGSNATGGFRAGS